MEQKFEDYIELDYEGKIRKRTLAENTTINGILWFKNEILEYDRSNNIINEVSRLIKLEDSVYINNVLYKKRLNLKFFSNGQVEFGHLHKHSSIDYIDFKKYIEFYRDGQVKHGYLAENVNIDGIIYKANTPIYFHENGKVKHGYEFPMEKRNYDTFEESVRSMEKETLEIKSKEEFDVSMKHNSAKNEDIENIDNETINMFI